MSTPEALRLAADLEAPGRVFSCSVVAAELRRQHAEIERLTAELAEARAALAATPAPAPLTDEQIGRLWDDHTVPVFGKTGINPVVFARAIERAHGIGATPAPHPDTADADPFSNLITIAEQVSRDLRAQDLLLEWQSLFDAAIDAARATAQGGKP